VSTPSPYQNLMHTKIKPPSLRVPSSLSRLEAVTDVASRQIVKLSADVEWYRHALGEKSAWCALETDRADRAEIRAWWLRVACWALALALVASCTALGLR
jgi:hypothetical protein